MNVHGAHAFRASPEAVFAAIRDPRVLIAVIPGCRDVTETGPDAFEGSLSLRLPGAVGVYRTHVQLVDVEEPRRASLDGRVEGAMGTIAGRADFVIHALDAGSLLEYDGTATIQGPLARLDSRFAEQLAASLVEQGLRALDSRLATEALA